MDPKKKYRGSNQRNECRNERGNSMETRFHSPQNHEKTRGESVHKPSKRVLRPPQTSRRPVRPEGIYSHALSKSKNSIEKQETAEEKKNRLSNQLLKHESPFESPFKWKPYEVKPLTSPDIIINRMKEKDKEVKDERRFKWRNFIFHLVICYESWRDKNLSQAFEEICSLKSFLQNRIDFFFKPIENSLWHVVLASEAFLFLEHNMLTEAEKIIGLIEPYHIMFSTHRSGIHGIKAGMFMEYGHRGNKYALKEAEKAIDLERTIPEWHFYVSKCLGRLRRVAKCHDLVDLMELRAINKAVEDDRRNTTYIVYQAQVVAERAFIDFKIFKPKRQSEKYRKIHNANHFAMLRFKEAAKLSPNSPHILIRCVKGMMRLPPDLKDLKFMKECIDKALELAPNNPMVHHVQAMYHERYDCNVELQLNAYEKADSLNNFGASIDLVRIHQHLKIGDVIEELEKLATRYEQTEKLQVIYTQAGSYLLFMRKDIVGAVKYYLKVMEIDSTSYAMKSHKPIFVRVKDPLNMFDILKKELATRTELASFSSEERKVLKTMVIKLMDYKPTEDRNGPTTVQKILEMSRELAKNDGLYRTRMARRSLRQLPKKLCKKWRGKNKSSQEPMNNTKINNVIRNISKGENLHLKPEVPKLDKDYSNLNQETNRRRDSCSSVDSNYHRDSSKFGPRDFFLQSSNESLCSTKSERISSNKQHHWLDSRDSKHNVKGRAPRDLSSSSRSSISSASSDMDLVTCQGRNTVYSPAKTTEESQLTDENLKKLDNEQSYHTGIQRISLFSLSNESLASMASSTDTLSVMDRVKQSYAMLGRENKTTGGEKKNKFKNHGSTQSLNIQRASDQEKDSSSKNCGKSGSTQSLDNTFLNNPKPRSNTFMPVFAQKDPRK